MGNSANSLCILGGKNPNAPIFLLGKLNCVRFKRPSDPAMGHGSCPPSLETRRRKDGEELAQGLVTLPFLSCSEPCSVRSPLPGPAPPTAHEGAPVPTEGSPARWHLPQRPVHTRAPGGGEHGAVPSSPEPSLPAGKCPRVAQESGTNASLGGGLLRAPRRLVLMVFTSCVSVQQKTRDAACLLPLSSALSLPLQTLDLNLLRIQHRGRRQWQQRQPAQPRGHRSLKMHHPACWIVFSVTTALLFIPGTQQGLSAPPGRFGAEGEGEWEPERKRECELRVWGEVGSPRAHTA